MVVFKSTTESVRAKEIVAQYLFQLDRHMQELHDGVAEKTLEIKDFADLIHVHPTHLSNTIQEVLHRSPCDLYEERLLNLAKELLTTSNKPIAEIARQMDYDPSNFTKFFKNYAGVTPKEFRKSRSEH